MDGRNRGRGEITEFKKEKEKSGIYDVIEGFYRIGKSYMTGCFSNYFF